MDKIVPLFKVGVMRTAVEHPSPSAFQEIVEAAVDKLDEILSRDLNLTIELFEFSGPHLSPVAGAYSPLDYLQLGITEKLERDIHFLLIVTEVDLSATTVTYVLALPSQLTNVGVISTKRLHPSFWGEPEDKALTVERLVGICLHTFGHLLGLSHTSDPHNALYDFDEVEALSEMQALTEEQIDEMRRNLPQEAREEVSKKHMVRFAFKQAVGNWPAIWHAVCRANPFNLVTNLPTMITAAFSVIIILFFSSEIWDVAGTIGFVQLFFFVALSVGAAMMTLYRAFTFGVVLQRNESIAESTVVTEAATILSLFLTLMLLYVGFFVLLYVGTVTIFPRKLMYTWPTVDPAIRDIDRVKLSLFLAAFGILAGSLGGRADSQDLVRNILFLDEET